MLTKSMAVLSLFNHDRRELGMLEAARLLGWPKSTTSRILSSLARAGFLDRDLATNRYRVGMRLAALGAFAGRATPLQQIVQPLLQQLTRETGETSTLAVRSGPEGVDIEVVRGAEWVLQGDWVGRRFPLHATASGKALIAWGEPVELRRLLGPRLRRFTPKTVTSFDRLAADLAQVRARGYAAVRGEIIADLVAVAAPVRDFSGEVVAAIAIGIPIGRAPIKVMPGLGRRVVRAADSASKGLGYVARSPP
jgi:IclR family transcriptional regulator, KDG regulon repressor